MFEIHWIELLIIVFLTAGIGFFYGVLFSEKRWNKEEKT